MQNVPMNTGPMVAEKEVIYDLDNVNLHSPRLTLVYLLLTDNCSNSRNPTLNSEYNIFLRGK